MVKYGNIPASTIPSNALRRAFVVPNSHSPPNKKSIDIFAPKTLDEYIGQHQIRKLLTITLDAAKKENRPLPNILLVGAFGLGKTALAKVLANEIDKKYHIIDGSSVSKNYVGPGNYIVDEIHNIDYPTCDRLNLALDDDSVRIIGCTTSQGLLPAPFRSRFRIFELERYSEKDLQIIAKHICARRGVTATDSVLGYIAARSKSNARQITIYLSTIFDSLTTKSKTQLLLSDVKEIFELWGVDDEGFLERDRRYVRALPSHPVGIRWLSAVLGMDQTTLEEEVEPYLLQKGVIDRTARGRVKVRDI